MPLFPKLPAPSAGRIFIASALPLLTFMVTGCGDDGPAESTTPRSVAESPADDSEGLVSAGGDGPRAETRSGRPSDLTEAENLLDELNRTGFIDEVGGAKNETVFGVYGSAFDDRTTSAFKYFVRWKSVADWKEYLAGLNPDERDTSTIWGEFDVDPAHAAAMRDRVFEASLIATEPLFMRLERPAYLRREDRLYPGGAYTMFIPLPFWTEIETEHVDFSGLPDGVRGTVGNCQVDLSGAPHFLQKNGSLVPPFRITRQAREQLNQSGEGIRYLPEYVNSVVAVTLAGDPERLSSIRRTLESSGAEATVAEDREGFILDATFDSLRYERPSRYGFYRLDRLLDGNWDCPRLRPIAGGGFGSAPPYFVTRLQGEEGSRQPPNRIRGRLLSLDFELPDGTRILTYRDPQSR